MSVNLSTESIAPGLQPQVLKAAVCIPLKSSVNLRDGMLGVRASKAGLDPLIWRE